MATCPECRARYSDATTRCPSDGNTLVPDETFGVADPELARGDMAGEYCVEAVIGRGSFGVVYRATHPVIGKAAAVKVLTRAYSANPQTVSRFIAEARAVNQIRHRNIVDIFSFGALPDGRQYYVMELLDGEPFDRYLASRGRLPPDQALPILDRMARALDAAHAAGIVHRDLKPANVFLAVDADGIPFPKLLDFGIAKLTRVSEQYSGHRTDTGMMLGTPYYMSPEQCRGEAIDHRADIYAFGVMIHEMLTGRLPLEGDTLLKMMMKHASAPPARLSEHNPALPPVLDAPVLRMLEKLTDHRPQSAGEAYRELSEAARAAGYHSAPPPPPTSRPVEPAVPGRSAPSNSKVATTLGPQTVSRPPPRNLVALTTAITGAVVVLGGLAIVFARTGTAPLAPVGSTQGPGPVEGLGSVERPVESARPPVPVVDQSVSLSIESTPKGAEVFLDGRSLGVAPGPIALARGESPITLVFKAPGHQQKSIEIIPSKDGAVTVNLSRMKIMPTHPGPHRPVDDLEF